jgi:asparagine synthase (glutamine-hydrolysing)
MCGIAGWVNFKSRQVEETMMRRMTDAMAHRGPDSDGFFLGNGVGLGHRRLSIIDLSTSANQPYTDNSGRYVIVFNGEIYNYASVKAMMPEYAFRTSGDTEVLIAAYAKWGAECLQHLKGMFSFAIWDKQESEIFVARDRLGVKPLYYSLDQDHFVFASEQRSLLATGLFSRKVDMASLTDYFSYQSIPYPYSAIESISQLEAGTWLRVKEGRSEKKVYWDVTNTKVDFDFSDAAAVQKRIRELLFGSVERRLVSDVPVGAFLSGGIDSSAVVGLMAEASSDRPNTFNIAFTEKEFDESPYADVIARKFNTRHTRLELKPAVFLEELENALGAMDIPSGDGVNTYVVSKAIRQSGITVALSGAGGDELFAGYPYFNQFLSVQKNKWLWNMPAPVRRGLASVAGMKNRRIRQLLDVDSPSIGDVYPVFRQLLSPEMLRRLTGLNVSRGSTALQQELYRKKGAIERLPMLSQVSAAEYLGYTQHTLLKDTDQMSMAVSLEVREPFFDADLVEFVLAVPDHIKKPAYPKSLLVESLNPMLPDEIVFRRKQGFLFPWSIWLKNELRSFCELRIKNISKRPFINGQELMAYWQRFLKGDPSVRWGEIWLFVVLEYWMEKNKIE